MSDTDSDNTDTTAQSPKSLPVPIGAASVVAYIEPLQVPKPPPSSDVSGNIISTNRAQSTKNHSTTICTESATVKTESSNKKG